MDDGGNPIIDSNGNPLPDVSDDDPSHYFGVSPGIDVEKHTNGVDADDAAGADVPRLIEGAPVKWEYIVTNTGNIDLVNIAIVDSQGVTVACLQTDLAPGVSITCTATGTAQSGGYENITTVSGTAVDQDGNPTTETVTDTNPSHYIGFTPAIELEKSTNSWGADAPSGPFIPEGDPVTWTYFIFNAGNTRLTNIALSDDQIDPVVCQEGDGSIPDLDPGQFHYCTVVGTAIAGQYENNASVTADPVDDLGSPVGDPVEDTDPSHYFNTTEPGIDVEKSTNGEDADVAPGPEIQTGGAVTWQYVITNTGNTVLSNISLSDSQIDPLTCNEGAIPDLEPGISFTCNVTGTATAGPYENIASISATPVDDNGAPVGPPVTDEDPSHYTGTLEPGVSVEKSTNGEDADDPTGPTLLVGDTVTWNYVVINSGNVTLDPVVVTDSQGVTVNCPQTSLTAGASMTCEATGTVTAGQYENIATVTGTPVDENGNPVGDPIEATDPSHYFGVQPAIDVEKSTNGQNADTIPGPNVPVGDAVIWTYVVTNTGNVPLDQITLGDDQTPFIDCSGQTSLAPGASMTCTATGTAVAGQYENNVTINGRPVDEDGNPITDENGNPIPDVTDTDPSHYFGIEPSVEVEKHTNGEDADAAPGSQLAIGDAVSWTYEVTNTGNVELTNVTVTDCQGVTVDCGGQITLAAGATMACTAAGTAVAGEYENIATVTGTPPAVVDENGNSVTPDPVTDDDPSHYYTSTEPAIHVEKTTNGEDADSTPGPYINTGGPVTWTYVVTNTGNTDLAAITLEDDPVGIITCPQTALAIGASMTCTASGTAVAGQYQNNAEATGIPVDANGDPTGDRPVSDDDPSHYYGISAGIELEKLTDGEDADTPTGPQILAGDSVTWTYVIYNSGDLTLTDVVLNDDQIGRIICNEVDPIPNLAPDTYFTCTYSGVASAGQYENNASVQATPVDENGNPAGPPIEDADPSHYFGYFRPGIDIEKRTNGADADTPTGPEVTAGETITWSYEIRNTGNSILTAIVINDDVEGPVNCIEGAIPELAPGETFVCSVEGVAMVGQYENNATVTATPVDEDGNPAIDENGNPIDEVENADPSHYLGSINTSIAVEKRTIGEDADEPTGPFVLVDDPVSWIYVIFNTGDVSLANIELNDSVIGPVTCREGPIPTLSPGAHFSCEFVGPSIPGQYENIATVVGTPVDENGEPIVDLQGNPIERPTDEDPSHYFGAVPSIDVEKATNGEDADEAPGPYVLIGNRITWSYVVTNTGNTTLVDILVTDNQGVIVNCPRETLSAGASMTCTASEISELGPYENIASVTGVPVDDQGNPIDEPVEDEDPSHYFGFDPGIDVEKTTNGADADTPTGPQIGDGDAVIWAYMVTNTGSIRLDRIMVTDDQGVAVSCPRASLEPGDTMTCTASGTATAGQYRNNATVNGTPVDANGNPVGNNVTNDDPSHYLGIASDNPPQLPPIIIDAPNGMSPIPFNAGSRGDECCLSLRIEHVTTSKTPDIIPVEGPVWLDTFNSMYAATEFAGFKEELSGWLRAEGIDPDREGLISKRYMRTADKAGMFAAFNVGNMTMQSGLGLGMAIGPDVRAAAADKGISPEQVAKEILQAMAADAGLAQMPTLNPLVIEFAGGMPIYGGDPAKGDLSWDRSQMDKSLVPLVWGTTLSAQAQLLPAYITSKDSTEQFAGKVMAWLMSQKVKLIHNDLIQKADTDAAYVAHAYRMKQSSTGIDIKVKSDEIRLSDQAALLWGLLRMRTSFARVEIEPPAELDAMIGIVWSTLDRLYDADAGTYADQEVVAPKDAMLTSLALSSLAGENSDLPMASLAGERLVKHTAFIAEKLTADDGGVAPGYHLKKDQLKRGPKTLTNQAAVLRALLVHRDGLNTASQVYAFMNEKLWDAEHGMFRDLADWPMTGTYTPEGVGAVVGGIGRLVVHADADQRVKMLDQLSVFFETVVAQGELQQRGNQGLLLEGARGLISGRGEITNLRRPIPVPSRRYRDDIIETGLRRHLAPVLVSEVQMNFIPLEAAKLQALTDSIDFKMERFGPRKPLFLEPIRLPKIGPRQAFTTAAGMLAASELMRAAPILAEQGRITDDAFFTDPSMAGYVATTLSETARGSLVRLTVQSGNGIPLVFSAPVARMAQAAGVTPEQALSDWLKQAAERSGLTQLPHALSLIYVEFSGGWPDYPKGLSEGLDVRGSDKQVSLAGLAQTLTVQLQFMEAVAKGQSPADPALDGFLSQVTGLSVAAKIAFIEKALKAATDAGLSELPSHFTLVRDSAGKVLDLLFSDPSESAFARISLLGALGDFVSMNDVTSELVPDYAELKGKAVTVLSNVWASIRTQYLDTSGRIRDLSLADAGLAADTIGQMVQAMPDGYSRKPGTKAVVKALAAYLTNGKVTGHPDEALEGPATRESLSDKAAVILGLIRAAEVLAQPDLVQAALDRFNAFDRQYWSKRIGTYLAAERHEALKQVRTTRYMYSAEDIGLTVGVLARLMPLVDPVRKAELANRLSSFTPHLVEQDILSQIGDRSDVDHVRPVEMVLTDRELLYTGDILIFKVIVENALGDRPGCGDLDGVKVSNVLPPGLSYIANSARVDERPINTHINGRSQTWTIDHMAMGETVIITFRTRVDDTMRDGIHRDRAESGGYCFHPVDGGDPAVCGITDDEQVALGAVNRIKGRIFLDSGGDGRLEPGDKGLAGIRVILDENRATDTDNTGTFWFDKLLPGIYQVRLDMGTLPEDIVSTTDTVQTVLMDAGKTYLVDFGLIRYKRILGAVFDDLNGDGIHDKKEPGVAAVRVWVKGTEYTAYTSDDGTFRIDGVPERTKPAVVIDKRQSYLKKDGAVLKLEVK